jgi:hypothetical protein
MDFHRYIDVRVSLTCAQVLTAVRKVGTAIQNVAFVGLSTADIAATAA